MHKVVNIFFRFSAMYWVVLAIARSGWKAPGVWSQGWPSTQLGIGRRCRFGIVQTIWPHQRKKSCQILFVGEKYIQWAAANRDMPKSTLCMNSWWLGTAEVSYKKSHILVEVEMSSHLFFYKLIWAFLWLTSAILNQPEFMQRIDLGRGLLGKLPWYVSG